MSSKSSTKLSPKFNSITSSEGIDFFFDSCDPKLYFIPTKLQSRKLSYSSEDLACILYGIFPQNDTFDWILNHLDRTSDLEDLNHETKCSIKLFKLALEDSQIFKTLKYKNVSPSIYLNIGLEKFRDLYSPKFLSLNLSNSEIKNEKKYNRIFNDFLNYKFRNLHIQEYDEYLEGDINFLSPLIPKKFTEFNDISTDYKQWKCMLNLEEEEFEQEMNKIQKSMVLELLKNSNTKVALHSIKKYELNIKIINEIIYHSYYNWECTEEDYCNHIRFNMVMKDTVMCGNWIYLMAKKYTGEKLKDITWCPVIAFEELYSGFLPEGEDNIGHFDIKYPENIITFDNFMYYDGSNPKSRNINGIFFDITTQRNTFFGKRVLIPGYTKNIPFSVEKYLNSPIFDFFIKYNLRYIPIPGYA